MKSFLEFIKEAERTKDRALDVGDRASRMTRNCFSKQSGMSAHRKASRDNISLSSFNKDDPVHLTYEKRGRHLFDDDKPKNIQNVAIKDLNAKQDHTDWNREKAKEKFDDNRHINVVRHEGKLHIIDGHHRVVAHRLLGKTHINANVQDLK